MSPPVAPLELTESEPRNGVVKLELKGELECIPLKALRKDRTERYRSAAEMADDIDNYLNCRPLIAGPQSNRILSATRSAISA